jgi:phage N-6-adenine-methyltransferase
MSNSNKTPFFHFVTSHRTVEWSTPQDFFDEQDAKYHFTIDVAADDSNHKCVKYYTKEENALVQDWDEEARREDGSAGAIWCNPPYGPGLNHWVSKAHSCKSLVVMLLPVRTSTFWFQKICLPFGEIEFLPKHLKFGDFNHAAPFDSLLVIFNRPRELNKTAEGHGRFNEITEERLKEIA